MFSASEPVLKAIGDYMTKTGYGVCKKLSETPTGTMFMISHLRAGLSPMARVQQADRCAAAFARRKGHRRTRHPISLKRATELWNKYVREFVPQIVIISPTGEILSSVPATDYAGGGR